jgi:hypothetical protein
VTVTVYVARSATLTTGLETSSEVEVESRLTETVAAPLEPATLELLDVKTAVRCFGEVDAANDVWHVAPCAANGSLAQPLIGVPPSKKVTDPEGDTVDVTAAVSVTA